MLYRYGIGKKTDRTSPERENKMQGRYTNAINAICLLSYENSPELLKRYLKLNKIKHIGIWKNFEHNYVVWEMTSNIIGLPVGQWQEKKNALEFAANLARIAKLTVVIS